MKKLLLLFSFYGSSSRRSHFKMLWAFLLLGFIFLLGLSLEINIRRNSLPLMADLIGIANLLVALSILILYYSQLWKRSHDIGISGWVVFFVTITIFYFTLEVRAQEITFTNFFLHFPAFIIYLILGCIPSKRITK